MLDFFKQAKDFFLKLTVFQRSLVIGLFVFVFFSITVLVLWSTRVEYVPLFTRIANPRHAKDIISALDTMKAKYKLADNEKTIMVPANNVKNLKMRLYSQDIRPNKKDGWKEIFKSQSVLGTEKAVLDINMLRGLQGELEETIMTLEPVEYVRVHIVQPKTAVFKADQKATTASVTLKLKPFQDLDITQVKGIMNLVSFSVEGLPVKNVKVINMKGQTLSDPVLELLDEELGGVTKKDKIRRAQLSYTQKVENDKKTKILGTLEQVFGAGKAAVSVDVEIDFDDRKQFKQKLAPPVEGEDQGMLVSSESIKEQYEGKGADKPEGVPGTASNVPGYKEVGKENTKYLRDEARKNFDTNKFQEDKVVATGTIKKMSASIFLDRPDMKESLQKQLTVSIGASIGYNKARGDNIQFLALKFDDTERKKLEEELARRKRIRNIIILSFLFGLLVIIFSVVLKMYLDKKARERASVAEAKRQEQLLRQAADMEKVLSVEEQELTNMEKAIRQRVKDNPKDVAQLLRNWIQEI